MILATGSLGVGKGRDNNLRLENFKGFRDPIINIVVTKFKC